MGEGLKRAGFEELVPGNGRSEELGALFDELLVIRELLEFADLFSKFLQRLAFALEALLQNHHWCRCRHGLLFYFLLVCCWVIRKSPGRFNFSELVTSSTLDSGISSRLNRIEKGVFRFYVVTERAIHNNQSTQ